ncbi:hypothetical protein KL907_003160 [Ogataea polymorpha]|nr:hypothetical protein KL907_003160 [Ogataea polymorpha]KAG7907937.1 hypothetical protein KL906_003354 [Ogataea polymorpha]
MSTLEQLELEEFGFQLRPAVQLFDPVAVQNLDAHHYNFLAISNKHSLLFAYLNNKLKLINTQELDKLLSTDPDTEQYTIGCLQEFEQADCLQIVISADESQLIIVKQNIIEQADLDSLKQGTWATEKLTSIESEVVHLAPVAPGVFAYLLANGQLMLFDGTGTRTLRQGCSCFSWTDGNTLLIGVDSHLELLRIDTGSSETISLDEDRKPLFVTVLEQDSWLVVLGGETEDDDTKSYVVTRDGATFKKSEAYDICMPFGVIPRKLSFYALHLHNWSSTYPHLAFLTSSKSTEFNTLTRTQQLLQLNDSDRAQMPLDPDSGDDDTPLGLVLDLTGKLEVLEPCQQVEKCGPLPKMIALTNRGQLLVWNIWLSTDINAGKVDLEAARKAALADTEKTEITQAVPEQTLPKDSGFSLSQNKTSLFGQSEKPAIQNPFGSSAATSSPFGKSGFAAASRSSAFGKSGFGQSAFGSAASGSSNSSGFGQSGFGSSGFSFGQPKSVMNTSSLNSTAAAKSFGAFSSFSSGTNAFASKSSSPFNLQPKEDIFANADKKDSSPFGEAKNASGNTGSSLFGQSSSAFKFGSANQATNDSPFAQLTSKPAGQEEKKDGQLSFGSSPFGSEFKTSLGLDNLKLDTKLQSPSPFASLTKNTESPFSSLNKKSESPFASLGNKESSPFLNSKTPAFDFSQSKSEADEDAGQITGDSEEDESEENTEESGEDDVLEENEAEAEGKAPKIPSLEDSDISERSAELDGSFEEIERPESLDAPAQRTEESQEGAEFDIKGDSEQPVSPSAASQVSQSQTEEKDAEQSRRVAILPDTKNSDDAAETEQDSTVETPQSDSNADQSVSESASELSAMPSAMGQSASEADKVKQASVAELMSAPKSAPVEKFVSMTESKVVEQKVGFGEIDQDSGPKAVPQLVSLGSVAIPQLSSNEVLREMEEIVYHTDAEFSILDENIRLFKEFMDDHMSKKFPRNFKDHGLFPACWRLSEVGKLSEVIEQNSVDYAKLTADLGATFASTSSLLLKLNAMTKQSEEISSVLKQLECDRKTPRVEKNLSPAASQQLDAIRKGYDRLRDLENNLHARLFVLNGRLFPERVLDSPTNFEVIISGLDAKLRTYYDQLKYLQEKISEYKLKDKPVTKLQQQFDKLSVASFVSRTAAKEQLSTYLQSRKFVTHTVEL